MNPTSEERAALLASYIDWDYSFATKELGEGLEAAFGSLAGIDFPKLDALRRDFFAKDAQLMELRDPEADWPEDLVRKVALQAMVHVEIDGGRDVNTTMRRDIAGLTLFLNLLDRVGWPEPTEEEQSAAA